MTNATNDDRRHPAELVGEAEVAMPTTTGGGQQISRPSSTVGFALGVARAAVTKNPDNDPLSSSTVRL